MTTSSTFFSPEMFDLVSLEITANCGLNQVEAYSDKKLYCFEIANYLFILLKNI